jgi:hypothetical protein
MQKKTKLMTSVTCNIHPVRLAYQPPASSTFLSEQTSHQQPASSTLLSEQTSTSHQPPANRTGRLLETKKIYKSQTKHRSKFRSHHWISDNKTSNQDLTLLYFDKLYFIRTF